VSTVWNAISGSSSGGNRATGSLRSVGAQDALRYSVAAPTASASSGRQFSTIGGVSGIDCGGVYAESCAMFRADVNFNSNLRGVLGDPLTAATGPARGAITGGTGQLIDQATSTRAGSLGFSAWGAYGTYKTLNGANNAFNQYKYDLNNY
jgi:hypothetical protein